MLGQRFFEDGLGIKRWEMRDVIYKTETILIFHFAYSICEK